MIFLSFLICNCLSFGQWISYIPEDSPKTIKIERNQILLINYPNAQERTLKISIPFVLSSPRYIPTKFGSFFGSFNFFYFNDQATIEMHFLHNISYYVDNATEQRTVSKICDYLLKNTSFNCNSVFKISSNENKPFDTSRSYNINSIRKEIQDFPSIPPHSLKILSTKSLLEKSNFSIDIGQGKNPLSSYYFTAQMLPFTAKLYISYKICSYFLIKEISVKNDVTLSLTVDDIPKKCYSYSASISISSDFPQDTLVCYQVNDDPLSEKIDKSKVYKFSKNSIFTVTFYVKTRNCIEYTIAKMVSIDNPFSITNATLFASDIPEICLDSEKNSDSKSHDL